MSTLFAFPFRTPAALCLKRYFEDLAKARSFGPGVSFGGNQIEAQRRNMERRAKRRVFSLLGAVAEPHPWTTLIRQVVDNGTATGAAVAAVRQIDPDGLALVESSITVTD